MLATLQVFQWFVQFADGYLFMQFDPNGKERQFKDFVPLSSYVDEDKSKSIDLKKNHWKNMEAEHGRVVKAGWLPFTEQQKTLYQKDPTIRIECLIQPQPLVLEIPEGFYPFLRKEVSIKYGILDKPMPPHDVQLDADGGWKEDPAEVYVSDIYLGAIRKSDGMEADMMHFDLNITTEKKETIDN